MTIPAVTDVSEFPPLVSLSAKVAAAYIASRKDVPIERVGEVIEGVYRSLVRIAAAEDTGSAAACRFLDTPVGREAMDRPPLRVVGGTDQTSQPISASSSV